MSIVPALTPENPTPRSDAPNPHACALLALSILQHREHTTANLELAVMALRGAAFPDLIAADRQLSGASVGN